MTISNQNSKINTTQAVILQYKFVFIRRLKVRDSSNYSLSVVNVFSLIVASNTGKVFVKVRVAFNSTMFSGVTSYGALGHVPLLDFQ